GGAWLAPGFSWCPAIAGVVGASLAVASASVFNMWWERATDPLMNRTRDRPLAARRLAPRAALLFGAALALSSLTILWLWTTPLATALAAGAILSYVLIYTPLKYKTPLALFIGAFPGAVPPLLGWAAITGEVGWGGLSLFAVLLVWQMPHYIAITLFRKDEFARAGIRCVPVVRGDAVARLQAVAWAVGLVPVSLLPTYVGVTGWFYAVVAAALGVAFAVRCARGLSGAPVEGGVRWARGLFVASLLYLPALVAAMAVDALLW
ncbi:MAG: heme o synthase, partial [Myxococcales bacterium]|nr:heme o synthase [Myxococcales bacterium]